MATEPKSIQNFEEAVQEASPMPLFNRKKEKSSYDYFKELGDSVLTSLENGTSPFIPNKEGFIDIQPAYNINTNIPSEGLTQIILLTKAAELKSPTNGFVTFETIKKAQDAGIECKIIKGSKGVVIPVVDEKNWGEIKFKNTWFNVSQIENSENLIAYCKEKMTEQWKKDVQYINEKYPNSDYKPKKNPAEKIMEKPNEKIVPLNEKTEEPYQYLAQVLNAVQSGRKLHVTPEQCENFKNKTVAMLNAEFEPGKRDLFAIKKICNSANKLYLTNRKKLQEHFQEKEKNQVHEKKGKFREYSYERGI